MSQRGDRLRWLMAQRPWCYWVFPSWWEVEDRNRFTVSIVVEGEAGHYPTGARLLDIPKILTVADETGGYEAACGEARALNRARGIGDRETDRIVASAIGSEQGQGERLL